MSLGLSAPAIASNFTYTYLDAAAVASILDDDLVIAADEHSSLLGAGASGSLQFSQNFYASISGGYRASDKSNSEISQLDGEASFGAAVALGDSTDINFSLGAVRAEAEICIFSTCNSIKETGVAYSLGGRHWVSPNVEAGIQFKGYDFDNLESVTGITLHLAGWLSTRSSVFAEFNFDDAQTSTVAIGYRFTFN